jgi:HEAT repeat protein
MTADQDALVATLIQRLKNPELTVRVHAGIVLGGIGVEARPALPALLELRRSEDVHDRRLAALTLGALGYDLAEAVPPLRDSLHDEDETVRRLAAEALQEMAPTRERATAA